MHVHRRLIQTARDLPLDLSCIDGMLLVTEGASDAVAGLDLGFWGVGRFSCTHGAKLLVKLVSRIRPTRLVLMGDADEPGMRGVESLASALLPYVWELKVVFPPQPHKDLRLWRQAGATFEDLMQAVGATGPLGWFLGDRMVEPAWQRRDYRRLLDGVTVKCESCGNIREAKSPE
jgi:hypothetical protein